MSISSTKCTSNSAEKTKSAKSEPSEVSPHFKRWANRPFSAMRNCPVSSKIVPNLPKMPFTKISSKRSLSSLPGFGRRTCLQSPAKTRSGNSCEMQTFSTSRSAPIFARSEARKRQSRRAPNLQIWNVASISPVRLRFLGGEKVGRSCMSAPARPQCRNRPDLTTVFRGQGPALHWGAAVADRKRVENARVPELGRDGRSGPQRRKRRGAAARPAATRQCVRAS